MKGAPKPDDAIFHLYMLTTYTDFGIKCMRSTSPQSYSLQDIRKLYYEKLREDSPQAKQLRVFHENISVAGITEKAAQEEMGERMNEETYCRSLTVAQRHALEEQRLIEQQGDFLEDICYVDQGWNQILNDSWIEKGRQGFLSKTVLKDMARKNFRSHDVSLAIGTESSVIRFSPRLIADGSWRRLYRDGLSYVCAERTC